MKLFKSFATASDKMPGKGSKRDAKVTWWGDLSGQLKRSTAPCPLLLSADTVEKLRLLLDPEISSGQINWYEQREVCILVVRQLLSMLEAENSNYLLEQFPPWILIVIFSSRWPISLLKGVFW